MWRWADSDFEFSTPQCQLHKFGEFALPQTRRAVEFHTNMLCCCFAGKETVDYLFYYSTEYEPIGFVTVDDLFHFHISNLVAPLNFTSVFNL